MSRFDGRFAVVTGGAAGIGLATATRLVAEGARVSLWDRDDRALAAAVGILGRDTLSVSLDVTDPGAVERAAGAPWR